MQGDDEQQRVRRQKRRRKCQDDEPKDLVVAVDLMTTPREERKKRNVVLVDLTQDNDSDLDEDDEGCGGYVNARRAAGVLRDRHSRSKKLRSYRREPVETYGDLVNVLRKHIFPHIPSLRPIRFYKVGAHDRPMDLRRTSVFREWRNDGSHGSLGYHCGPCGSADVKYRGEWWTVEWNIVGQPVCREVYKPDPRNPERSILEIHRSGFTETWTLDDSSCKSNRQSRLVRCGGISP